MRRPLCFASDYGHADDFAGVCRGVIARVAPDVRVIDVTHGLPERNVLAGALVLRNTLPYLPDRAVHLAVVDPGVDHREMHGPVGQVRQRVAEHEGPGQHVALRQPMGDVDDAHVGRDACDHAAAHAGKVVGVTVVTGEAEWSAHGRNLRRCARRRNVWGLRWRQARPQAVAAIAATSPAAVCSAASTATGSPSSRSVSLVTGPMEQRAAPESRSASGRPAPSGPPRVPAASMSPTNCCTVELDVKVMKSALSIRSAGTCRRSAVTVS